MSKLSQFFFKWLIPKRYRVKAAKKILGKEKLFEFLGISCIDNSEIDEKIKDMGSASGVFEGQRTPKLVVSLTSYPERENDLKYTLYSLLNQNLKPDEIALWFTYEECPDKENSINDDIFKFKQNGIAIKFCHNLKCYNKLLPSLREYKDSIIVTADDDIYYEANWLEKLYEAYKENPKYIHCHRAHEISFDKNGEVKPYESWKQEISWEQAKPSFLNFLTGVGGVLYPPNSLHQDVFNEELILKLSPSNDDIWFWAMAVLHGTKINVIKENILRLVTVNLEQALKASRSLNQINNGQGRNDMQLKAVLKHYNLYNKLGSD